jgi:hypothetical protein
VKDQQVESSALFSIPFSIDLLDFFKQCPTDRSSSRRCIDLAFELRDRPAAAFPPRQVRQVQVLRAIVKGEVNTTQTQHSGKFFNINNIENRNHNPLGAL